MSLSKPDAHNAETERVDQSYRTLFGHIPELIEHRRAVAERTNRRDALEAIEVLRQRLIMENPLGLKVQQLVHFGQLIALGHNGPAIAHAGAARKAGATLEELTGVAETALITAGMPAYTLGMTIIAHLAESIGE